jgi:hypothetical protein
VDGGEQLLQLESELQQERLEIAERDRSVARLRSEAASARAVPAEGGRDEGQDDCQAR